MRLRNLRFWVRNELFRLRSLWFWVLNELVCKVGSVGSLSMTNEEVSVDVGLCHADAAAAA